MFGCKQLNVQFFIKFCNRIAIFMGELWYGRLVSFSKVVLKRPFMIIIKSHTVKLRCLKRNRWETRYGKISVKISLV